MGNPAGEKLKKYRAVLGEPLEQIARKLHIKPRYLEALENGDQEALPSNVQARGFLRSYAGYLGLDIPKILDLWEGVTKDEPVEQPRPLESNGEEVIPVDGLDSNSEMESEPETVPPQSPSGSIEVEETPQTKGNTSNALMIQIGAVLRQQRELLGMNLDEVERNIRIRKRYLAALEQGQLDELHSPVQGRGMLSNYAGFLGLDVDILIGQFAEALQTRRIEKLPPSKTEPGSSTGKTRRKPAKTATWRRIITPDMLIGGGIILALLVFALWSASQVNLLQTRQQAPTPLPIADILLQTQTPVLFLSPTATGGVRPGTQPAAGNQPAATAASVTTITPAPGISGPIQVIVVPRARTYLLVSVDGKVMFDGRVIPGNAYPFGGDRRIEMLVGSAAALQVFYNQNDLGSLGLVGQVRSLVFTREGLLTPTVQFTPTSTRTSLPSSTPRSSPTLPNATNTPIIPRAKSNKKPLTRCR